MSRGRRCAAKSAAHSPRRERRHIPPRDRRCRRRATALREGHLRQQRACRGIPDDLCQSCDLSLFPALTAYRGRRRLRPTEGPRALPKDHGATLTNHATAGVPRTGYAERTEAEEQHDLGPATGLDTRLAPK
jgi:hypothetical protein